MRRHLPVARKLGSHPSNAGSIPVGASKEADIWLGIVRDVSGLFAKDVGKSSVYRALLKLAEATKNEPIVWDQYDYLMARKKNSRSDALALKIYEVAILSFQRYLDCKFEK